MLAPLEPVPNKSSSGVWALAFSSFPVPPQLTLLKSTKILYKSTVILADYNIVFIS